MSWLFPESFQAIGILCSQPRMDDIIVIRINDTTKIPGTGDMIIAIIISSVLPSTLISQPKQPKRNLIAIADFDIIQNGKSIVKSGNLFIRSVFASNFNIIFIGNFKINSVWEGYNMPYTHLTHKEWFAYASNIGLFSNSFFIFITE